jgi:hypothetical protein
LLFLKIYKNRVTSGKLLAYSLRLTA